MARSSSNTIFSEAEILNKYGCNRQGIEETDITGYSRPVDTLFLPNGWKFAVKSSLTKDYSSLASNENSAQWLNDSNITLNGHKLKIPPMLFAHDITFAQFNDTRLSYISGDAITSWASQHVRERIQQNSLKIIKVPCAKTWTNTHIANSNNASITSSAPFEVNHVTSETILNVMDYDWTLSSDYCFSLQNISNSQHCIVNARELCESLNNKDSAKQLVSTKSYNDERKWKFEVQEKSGINYELLKRNDEPILFYDECLLYQDDLDDSGEISLETKFRVMPSCWFSLSKQYLRVDGTMVRCREIRVFHQFHQVLSRNVSDATVGTDNVENNTNNDAINNNGGDGSSNLEASKGSVIIHIEIAWREEKLSDADMIRLTASASETMATTIPSFTATTSKLSNIPVPMRPPSDVIGKLPRFAKSQTQNLPLVNEQEGIAQYYTLTLNY